VIYIFTGSDFGKAAEKAASTLRSLREKKPDASIISVSEELTPALIDELVGGQGLFERKIVASFEHVFDDAEAFETIADRLSELKESENIFLFKEGTLPKKVRAAAEKHAEKIWEFTTVEKQEKFSDFALADAVGKRDRKGAWVLLIEAYARGAAPEALHGMLFWKLKTLLLQKTFRAFTENELRAQIKTLVALYHEARRGKGELTEKLEAFVLSI
jgi:hypothetical protein